MSRIQKAVSIFLAGVLLMLSCAYADGFSTNADRINEAAKSVMFLEVKDKDGDVIKTGSGFVAFDNRHLITNYHVADGADTIYAYSDSGDPYIIMDVCISDSEKDIAILQFFSPTDLKPLELNEAEIRRASPVVAIGSPKGFVNTVSTGIVSSLYEEDGVNYVQFTAPISSGSSGGALFNDDGQVIGITTMSYDDGQGVNQNLNFAVNIQEALDLYALWDRGTVRLSNLRESDASRTLRATETPVPTATPQPMVTFSPTPVPTMPPAITQAPTQEPIWRPEETATPVPVNESGSSSGRITILDHTSHISGNSVYIKFTVNNGTEKAVLRFKVRMTYWSNAGGSLSPVAGLKTDEQLIETPIRPGNTVVTSWYEAELPEAATHVNVSIFEVEYLDGTTETASVDFGSRMCEIR